jgi:hypothetical protein
MEFEKEVCATLEKHGYHIFHRNLELIVNGHTYTEFDVVCSDFILEIKSGNYVDLNGLHKLYQEDRIPKGFRIYVYCPVKTTKEITEYNSDYDTTKILYINTLDAILENHKPQRICNIETQSMFDRFLNLRMDTIRYFDKVYVHLDAFLQVVRTIACYRESYSRSDGMRWSDKLVQIVKEGIVEVRPLLDRRIPFLKKTVPVRKLMLKDLNNFKLDVYYNVHCFNRCRDIEHKYYKTFNPATIASDTESVYAV